MQYFLKKRLSSIQASGMVTLLLSNIVLFCTLGVFCIKLLFNVYRCGKHTDTDVANSKGRCNTALILGKQLQSGLPDQEYIERLERGKKLFESGKVLKLVLLGGITGDDKISEAQAGKHYLVKNGVPDESVILEDKSRYTLENLQHARDLLSQEPEQVSVLITSRYHLKRSAEIARGIGSRHILCAAEKEWKIKFNTLWRILVEAYYLHWYFVGKYWLLLTNNKKWLQRIT